METVKDSSLKQLSFLDLPSEVRHPIYEYYLFGERGWNPRVQTFVLEKLCHYKCRGPKFSTDIFRVNKFISEESTHYFYSRCTFHVSDKPECRYFRLDRDRYNSDWAYSLHSSIVEFYPFLQGIGMRNRQSIRNLEVNIGFEETVAFSVRIPEVRCKSLTKGFRLLSAGHNLRLVSLKFEWKPALKLFTMRHDLMEAFSKIRGLNELKVSLESNKFPSPDFLDKLYEKDAEKIRQLISHAQSKDAETEGEQGSTEQ